MKSILFAATAAIALTAVPASARILQFTISNVAAVNNKGDFSFTIDEDRVPDIVLADQVRYGVGTPTTSPKLDIGYANVPGFGAGTFASGVTFFTSVQQGGLTFTGPAGNVRLINTTLITNSSFSTATPKDQNKALFKLGTFAISTTAQNSSPTRPFDNYLVTITAVPEPASWAMMIGGFGLVGLATRRRTRARSMTA